VIKDSFGLCSFHLCTPCVAGYTLRLVLRLMLTHHGPDESCEFSGDCDDGFILRFALPGQSPKTLMQAKHGPVGDVNCPLWLSFSSAFKLFANARAMSRVPATLGQQSTNETVAGLCDRSKLTPFSAGVLRRCQAEITHQGLWRFESAELEYLGD